MIGVKVAGSRERKKNKQHMKQYRANKEASKDTEGKEDEVVQEEVDVVEMVEEEGPGGGDAKKIQEETDRGSCQKVTFNLIERLFLWIVLNKALLQMYKNKKIPPVNNK